MIDLEEYKSRAQRACIEVFQDEYKRSLGIPLPRIEFTMPDSPNYHSGEYYILIGDTWQIHLNFGMLPKSFKAFEEEVKVIVRHEIEHYMCCPFDMITHLRMLEAIVKTYEDQYSSLKLDINSLANSVANQLSDIIIDTKNFRRHPNITAKSEREWIAKCGGGNFSDFPRHQKLMFLTKQALWGIDLGLNEVDEELLVHVNTIAALIADGLTLKSFFIEKMASYAHLFFKVFSQDQQDEKRSESNNNSATQREEALSSKDLISPGNSFVFQDSEKISDSLKEYARDCSIETFINVTAAVGVSSLSKSAQQKIWFEAQQQDIIPISETIKNGSPQAYSYPAPWKIGDPMEEMDMMLSFASSPIFIPGITTRKWIKDTDNDLGIETLLPDLLFVLDTSLSMGTISKHSSNIHQAIHAIFGILHFFYSSPNQVSLISFSDTVSAEVSWTKDHDEVKDNILFEPLGGTRFPIMEIRDMVKANKSKILMIVITDGELGNLHPSISFFEEFLDEGNTLYVFLQDSKDFFPSFAILRNLGAKIIKALTADEMRNEVLYGF